jgi:hypothetical protein
VKFSIENASRTRIVLADTYVPLFSHHRFLADWQERTYPRLSAEYQDCQRCCRFLNFGFATWYVPLWINFLDDADVPREGLRSFEICWSEAQAAILEHCLGYRSGVYVLIFGFSACSNDYLHDDVRSLGLYH